MITAIFVIVIMASVGAFVMNLSGKMVKETTTQYRHEQAILYAKSYTEFALMAATHQACAKKISANIDGNDNEVLSGQGYRVEAYIHYIGDNTGCIWGTQEIGGDILHPNSVGGTILIDTYVHYRDPEDPRSTSSNAWSVFPGTTYHRRTLQRL